jgi:serine/threonine-protein phosphatase 2A activator
MFGAAQLQGHDVVRPSSITNDDTLEVYAPDYLYMDAVLFVRRVKKGPLHETSPLLYDISGVPSWGKVWPRDCFSHVYTAFELPLSRAIIG